MTTQRTVSGRPSRVSLAGSVYEILFERIIDGTIPAGAPLNIDALAGTAVRVHGLGAEVLERSGLDSRAARR